jgi:hypothetical protein
MVNPLKKLQNAADRKGVQRTIMGKKETHRQEREQLAAENRTRRDPTARGKAAIKRVGEYKAKKKMAGGGLCRGGGAATRGLNFRGDR